MTSASSSSNSGGPEGSGTGSANIIGGAGSAGVTVSTDPSNQPEINVDISSCIFFRIQMNPACLTSLDRSLRVALLLVNLLNQIPRRLPMARAVLVPLVSLVVVRSSS